MLRVTRQARRPNGATTRVPSFADVAPATHLREASPAAGVWRSWSATTSASPSSWAEIARAAAEAPVIVVMQGMPWRTASLRIS